MWPYVPCQVCEPVAVEVGEEHLGLAYVRVTVEHSSYKLLSPDFRHKVKDKWRLKSEFRRRTLMHEAEQTSRESNAKWILREASSKNPSRPKLRKCPLRRTIRVPHGLQVSPQPGQCNG